MQEKIKLVLLIGSGRSGSTVIDRVINMDEEIFGVGELVHFNSDIFDKYCSCGDIVKSCSFWSQVILKLGWTDKDWMNFKDDQNKFENPKRGSVFRIKNYFNEDGFDTYLSKNKDVLQSMSELSYEKVIFDSSKSAQRAFNFSKSDFFDVKVIFLMRDPRGAVWSFKKSFQKNLQAGVQKDMKGKSMLRAIYSWIAVNSRSFSAVKSINQPTLFVKYEDFCESPELQISRIQKFIFDEKPKKSINLNEPRFIISHTIAGNRLRMQKSIIIKPDNEWRKNLSFLQKIFIYVFTYPLLKKFKVSLRYLKN